LGRAYALYFASRGAKVVVNDLGGSRSGEGISHSAADIVVKKIREAGGEAIADYHNVVTDGAQIVTTAVQQFGRIDVLINNAGILRDKIFMKMQDADFTRVFDVHVNGAHQVTHAAWPLMLKQGYGRIIMTGSAAGIYGNYGQTNYGAAKYALAGMALSLAREGLKKNVYVNYVAPLAASRITETVLPADILALLSPDKVAPFVAYLCHEGCQETGSMFEVGGGYVARVDYERSSGLQLTEAVLTPENISARWNEVGDFNQNHRPVEHPKNITDVDWVAKAQCCFSSLSDMTEKKSRDKRKAPASMAGMVAIISGAGGGLGRAYALALGAHGCAVCSSR
jgi:multifunctional beta-oxidation protein